MKLRLNSKSIFNGTLSILVFFSIVYLTYIFNINITVLNVVLQALILPFILAIGLFTVFCIINLIKNKKENKTLTIISFILLISLSFLIIRSFINI